MAAHVVEVPRITSLIDPNIVTADIIVDAFTRFPGEHRALAAYLFVHLTRIALQPLPRTEEGQALDPRRNRLEECRKAEDGLRVIAEGAVFPPFEVNEILKAAAKLASFDGDCFEEFLLPYAMLMSVVDLVEQNWETELMRLTELMADRHDRDGVRALLFAWALRQNCAVSMNRKFDVMNPRAKRIIEVLHQSLNDDELRRLGCTAVDGLIGVTSQHSIDDLPPEDAVDHGRSHDDRVTFLALFGWNIFPYLDMDVDVHLLHAEEDAFFFSDETSVAELAGKVAQAVSQLADEDREVFVSAFAAEGRVLEHLLMLDETKRRHYFGEPDVPQTEKLTNAVLGFVRIGRSLAGRDDIRHQERHLNMIELN